MAYALADEGAHLILSARRQYELERVAANIKSPVFILPLDLEKHEELEEKKNAVLQKFGRVDVLINNGGISQRSLAKDTDVRVDKKIFDINFFSLPPQIDPNR